MKWFSRIQMIITEQKKKPRLRANVMERIDMKAAGVVFFPAVI